MPRRPPRATVQREPPHGRIRQSQMISTFGPGAMLDLLTHAVLVGGLDFWRMTNAEEVVSEPRLRDEVAKVFAERKWPLSVDAPFRKPPAGDEQNPNKGTGVQVYEFPRWFVCQNPRCRALVRGNHLQLKGDHYLHQCGGTAEKPERCVPIRFVVACIRGHIDDVEWPYWAHEGQVCPTPAVRLEEGITGDFAEVAVRCTFCGRSRRMTDLMVPERSMKCSGARPWLGGEGKENCEERQRLLVRTASNGYFAQVMSALSIPESDSVRRRVQSVWRWIKELTAEDLPTVRKAVPPVREALGNYSNEEVMAAIVAERENKPEGRPDLRTAEYNRFVQEPKEKVGELPSEDPREQFWARRIDVLNGLPAGFSRVVAARKLREVMVQIGFTRLEPATKDLQGRVDLAVEAAALSLNRDWLPAVEVRGEGVFLQLDEDLLRSWEASAAVKVRGAVLLKGYERWRQSTKSKMEFPGVRFYLLHSLSHALMSSMSLECGYPASALSERIYCASANEPVPMAAILLSTGTTGTEGTLGGLVEEGRRLRQHLRRALDDARLCSNDPVCSQHRPGGPDDRNLEGAACHGCLFVPECSCERFNQFLDRALVFPTLGHENVAFIKAV